MLHVNFLSAEGQMYFSTAENSKLRLFDYATQEDEGVFSQ